jgi:hypothetical protein
VSPPVLAVDSSGDEGAPASAPPAEKPAGPAVVLSGLGGRQRDWDEPRGRAVARRLLAGPNGRFQSQHENFRQHGRCPHFACGTTISPTGRKDCHRIVTQRDFARLSKRLGPKEKSPSGGAGDLGLRPRIFRSGTLRTASDQDSRRGDQDARFRGGRRYTSWEWPVGSVRRSERVRTLMSRGLSLGCRAQFRELTESTLGYRSRH